MTTENEEARQVLSQIHDLALGVYPFPEGAKVDGRFSIAFGLILGIASEALTAQHDGRMMRIFAENFHPAIRGVHELWRTDDNGNEVFIDRFPNRADAEKRLATLEARGHKQHYEIRVTDV